MAMPTEDHCCFRIRGTFLEMSTAFSEQEKEQVQKGRSHSAPPLNKALSKVWHCNHACGQSEPATAVADKNSRDNDQHRCMVESSTFSQSDHSTDVPDSDTMDEQDIGNNNKWLLGKQCPCCGENMSACACRETLFSEAGGMDNFMVDAEPSARSSVLAEDKDEHIADGLPNSVYEGDAPGRSTLGDEDDDDDDVCPKFNEGSTVMLCNIPCRVGRHDLVKALEAYDFADSYNFIHLPKGKSRRYRRYGNIGYTFIGFNTPDTADKFAKAFDDFQFPGMRSVKKCKVKLAHMAGFNAKAPGVPELQQ